MAVQMEIWCVLLLLGLSTALVCPDGGMCEDRNTCCKNTVGGYGCCPLPHAECCSDHLHCCYEGTLCDLVHEQCVNKTVSLPWMRRLPAQPALPVAVLGENVKKIVCADQKSTCDDGSTCCQLLDGSWGCCPLVKAVCCEDKLHCCPEGTKCDTAREMCVSASLESFPMLKKLPAGRRENNPVVVGSVTCPGGKSSCPDSYTCCLLTSGDYGCCPYPQAMCCSDHLHCCPSNTQCDLEHGVCRSGDNRVPMLKKIPATPNDVQCPDKTMTCPDQTTCCQMTNGSYGCCPMPNAVCCSDHMHCCPEGTQCDLKHSTCALAHRDAIMASRITAAATKSRGGSVPCNDSVSCADGSTCCKMLDGEWVCCPLPQAVCCDDHEHCCPHGTVCNLAASTCDDPSGLSAPLPWREKIAATPRLRNSMCDKSTSCPGNSTCCRTTTGDWACCPLPEAVCCDDHIHCCPHATVCNLDFDTCDDPSGLLAPLRWTEKVAALRSDVQCDEQTSCPGGTTCCKRSSGEWSCCPLPQAVCCDDHEHCCPAGYLCDLAEQTCDKPGGVRLPWLRKIPALLQLHQQQRQKNEPDRAGSVLPSRDRNMCDAHTSCPRDTTCCFMDQSHRWGCCPLPKAVCCDDGNHCCPAGHTCQPHRSSCSKGPQVVPWFSKLSALTEPGAMTVTDVKCDDKSSCASGTTCCKLSTGEWGCCPLVKAVCCADQEHCCPQGYTCNMQTGTCEKKNLDDGLVQASVPQTQVVRPESGHPEDDDVPCDSAGSVRCSGQETCCKTSPTDWACCPSPRATCCSDLKHCCPVGYSCDPTAGGCTLENARLTWDILFGDRRRDFVPQGL